MHRLLVFSHGDYIATLIGNLFKPAVRWMLLHHRPDNAAQFILAL